MIWCSYCDDHQKQQFSNDCTIITIITLYKNKTKKETEELRAYFCEIGENMFAHWGNNINFIFISTWSQTRRNVRVGVWLQVDMKIKLMLSPQSTYVS